MLSELGSALPVPVPAVPLCYVRSLSMAPNFTSRIPFFAHVETTTQRELARFLLDVVKSEPRVAVLFSPPGFGKNDATIQAASSAGALYVRAAASRTPLFTSLLRSYKSKLNELALVNQTMLVEDLLEAVKPLSLSFVIHMINLVVGMIEKVNVVLG
jgi:hypothetical protein